ncbi:type II secretion system protein [Planomonospora parontospora subsp. parontospora]|uniref:Type II secretion system protein n=2 Tax=Planomonospora parontospora TaxID=58119 RepID=A0AA37F8A9_9ACTN|nr:type II secretion system F family protein [Planomonospora parontospora]GGK99764.1 type II secretion system protein [Planomonospora parontospora]GII13039.1 type II secretion system protein [Planomonospora parontospora subsp. parontospora]
MGALTLMAGFGALIGAVVLAWRALTAGRGGRRVAAARLAAVEDVYGAGAAPPEPAAEPFADRVLRPLAARFGELGRRLTPAGLVARLHRSLSYAGNPPKWPAERVMQAKGLGLAGGALLGPLYGSGLGGSGALIGAVAGAAAGFLLPDLLIYNLGVRRQQEIARTLPDVLDMLTVSVEAGLGFDAAVAQVRSNAEGPMAGEFARVLREMQIGKPRSDALRAMAGRTTVVELRGFAAAVVQAGELGVPIANVLREQSREMRLRRRQRAEEAAQKVPIKILFPLLFCLFPALFVIIIGPGALRIMELLGT